MPQPHKNQISLIDTHFTIVFPAVFGAHFCAVRCGDLVKDKFTGQSYEHRRGWVEELLLFLSSVFSIDSAATVFVLML
jgi:hypothetical protein